MITDCSSLLGVDPYWPWVEIIGPSGSLRCVRRLFFGFGVDVLSSSNPWKSAKGVLSDWLTRSRSVSAHPRLFSIRPASRTLIVYSLFSSLLSDDNILYDFILFFSRRITKR